MNRHNVISIGWGCSAAGLLQQANIRTEALPFDWIKMPLDGWVYGLEEPNQFETLLSSQHDNNTHPYKEMFPYTDIFPHCKPPGFADEKALLRLPRLISKINSGFVLGLCVKFNKGPMKGPSIESHKNIAPKLIKNNFKYIVILEIVSGPSKQSRIVEVKDQVYHIRYETNSKLNKTGIPLKRIATGWYYDDIKSIITFLSHIFPSYFTCCDDTLHDYKWEEEF